MDSATYHTDTPPLAQPLFVLKRHEDGTVDLGTKAKVLVIGRCPVSETAKVGHCVITPAASAESEKK